MPSQKSAKSVLREAGVLDDAAHRDRIHRVVPWDGHNPLSVRHDDVFALPGNTESGLFERPDGSKVGDPGYLWHSLRRDFDFPQISLTGELFGDFQVFADGGSNIL